MSEPGFRPRASGFELRILTLAFALLAWLGGAARAVPLVPVADVTAGEGTVIEVTSEPELAETARVIAAQASADLARIRTDLDRLPAPARIQLQIVRDASSLGSVAPQGRGAPSYAVGVAYPDLGVLTIALRRGAEILNTEVTLRHELAHIALGAALGDRAPHWLHEGFAYQRSGEWNWDRMEMLAGMAWFGGLIELGALDANFPAGEAPANRAYAESYDFVGFLARRGRWEDPDDAGDRRPFRKWLALIGNGATLEDAAVKAYGKPLHALFEEWRSDLSKRYMLAPIGLFGLGLWVLCGLLLAVAWWRRRRSNRRRIAQWDREDRARDADERARQAEQAARLRPIIDVPWTSEPPPPPDPEPSN